MCTLHWFLVCSESCTTITTIGFQNIYITPEEKSLTFSSHSPLPLAPLPLATINLLSVSADLPILDISYK